MGKIWLCHLKLCDLGQGPSFSEPRCLSVNGSQAQCFLPRLVGKMGCLVPLSGWSQVSLVPGGGTEGPMGTPWSSLLIGLASNRPPHPRQSPSAPQMLCLNSLNSNCAQQSRSCVLLCSLGFINRTAFLPVTVHPSLLSSWRPGCPVSLKTAS